MHHNHRNLIIPTYDTEVLEKALEEACNGNIQIRHRLELRSLAISLWYAREDKWNSISNKDNSDVLKALTNFRANLQRRKKKNDHLTTDRLMNISQPAQSLLLSEIAYIFRDVIDDFTQIDFSSERHVDLLSVAIEASISKAGKPQGRPVNEAMDIFFLGLKNLYEKATGKQAIAQSCFKKVPKTHFEKLLYPGYQIMWQQEYPSALKAYKRALERNSQTTE